MDIIFKAPNQDISEQNKKLTQDQTVILYPGLLVRPPIFPAGGLNVATFSHPSVVVLLQIQPLSHANMPASLPYSLRHVRCRGISYFRARSLMILLLGNQATSKRDSVGVNLPVRSAEVERSGFQMWRLGKYQRLSQYSVFVGPRLDSKHGRWVGWWVQGWMILWAFYGNVHLREMQFLSWNFERDGRRRYVSANR